MDTGTVFYNFFTWMGVYSYIDFALIPTQKILRDFWEEHTDSKQQLKSWFQGASNAKWKSPKEIKKEYPSASILGDNRVVFNIKGNKYRLIVKINYDYQMAWVRFIGTHAGY